MKKTIITTIAAAGLSTTLTGCPANQYGMAKIIERSPESIKVSWFQYANSLKSDPRVPWPEIKLKVNARFSVFTSITYYGPVKPGETMITTIRHPWGSNPARSWKVSTCVQGSNGDWDHCVDHDWWPEGAAPS